VQYIRGLLKQAPKRPLALLARIKLVSWSDYGVREEVILRTSYFQFVPFFLFSSLSFISAISALQFSLCIGIAEVTHEGVAASAPTLARIDGPE
jgi:hypothetical protein